MILEVPLEEVEGQPARELPVPAWSAFYASILAGLIVMVGILFDPLMKASSRGVANFDSRSRPAPVATVVPVREVPAP